MLEIEPEDGSWEEIKKEAKVIGIILLAFTVLAVAFGLTAAWTH